MSVTIVPKSTLESLQVIKQLNHVTGDVLKESFDVHGSFKDSQVVEYLERANIEYLVLCSSPGNYNVYELEHRNGYIQDLRFTAQDVSLKHFARILKTKAINWFADHAIAI